MATLDEDFYKIGTSFKRPIPGESLTRSPEDRYAWEQPPAITDPREASRFFLTKLTEPEVYNSVLDSVEQGTPLMDIAQVLMYQAFVDQTGIELAPVMDCNPESNPLSDVIDAFLIHTFIRYLT